VASSRESRRGAGWACSTPGAFHALVPPGTERHSWISASALWSARGDIRARLLGDPSLRRRRAWVAEARARGAPADLVVDRMALAEPSFLVLGDPGEGDASQYAVVPPLLTAGRDTDFMVVVGDVVYPAGRGANYAAHFFRPYRDYPAPIHAVPGNHDWYDGLRGFMACFCGLPAARPEREPVQPGSYFAIDTGPLRLVCIDVGITDRLDAEQGAWLRRVALARRGPKVLLSGTPIYAAGAREPLPIEGGGTVDEIVRDERYGFVAAFAGDVHNYQRYPVDVGGGRVVQYVACGGGGAFTNETHSLPRVSLPGVDEADVRLYPLRGDSLSYYAKRYGDWWARRRGRGRRAADLALDPDVAAALMAERLGLEPVRPGARTARVDDRARRAAARVFPLSGYRGLDRFFSEYWDADDPPLFKSFVRVDVADRALRLRCFAATGCGEHEADPPVEDDVVVPLS